MCLRWLLLQQAVADGELHNLVCFFLRDNAGHPRSWSSRAPAVSRRVNYFWRVLPDAAAIYCHDKPGSCPTRGFTCQTLVLPPIDHSVDVQLSGKHRDTASGIVLRRWATSCSAGFTPVPTGRKASVERSQVYHSQWQNLMSSSSQGPTSTGKPVAVFSSYGKLNQDKFSTDTIFPQEIDRFFGSSEPFSSDSLTWQCCDISLSWKQRSHVIYLSQKSLPSFSISNDFWTWVQNIIFLIIWCRSRWRILCQAMMDILSSKSRMKFGVFYFFHWHLSRILLPSVVRCCVDQIIFNRMCLGTQKMPSSALTLVGIMILYICVNGVHNFLMEFNKTWVVTSCVEAKRLITVWRAIRRSLSECVYFLTHVRKDLWKTAQHGLMHTHGQCRFRDQ